MPLLATAALAMMLMQGTEAADAPPAAPYTTLSQRLRSWASVLPFVDKPDGQPAEQHWKSRPSSDKIRRYMLARHGWSIVIRKDAFTGQTRCQLKLHPKYFSDKRVAYADGVMRFRFNDHINPSKVWFRVDDGPARPWSSVYRDLMVKGLQVIPYDAGYKSSYQVLIPMEDLQGGHDVYIRTTDNGKPARFDISRFEAAYQSSKSLGCVDGAYVSDNF
ncbi:MAG: hypothetical protein JF615_05720 [Asticcacaulis sp.]|nr:hypothetical protein [Asticcacaulis sp.]